MGWLVGCLGGLGGRGGVILYGNLYGRNRVGFDQVPEKCADRELICVLVSRFLIFPVQMNLSEKVLVGQNPLSRVLDPSGVGGYMRKRELKSFEIN